MIKENLEEYSNLINSFIEYGKSNDISLNINYFDYIPTIGVVCSYPNILLALNKNLKPDKEGLLNFSVLENQYERKLFRNGYLYSDKYMVMASSYFRRGYYFASNFAPSFIDLYWNYENPDNDKYIALDLNRVRINVDDPIYEERDIWYGAKFKDKIENIEDGIIKLRPPLDIPKYSISSFFGDVYSLDIKWSTKNNIKVFQCKEFKTESIKINICGDEYFPVKYIHAEYNMKTGSFRHFDGAIHFYTEEEYLNRRDTDFNHNYKNTDQIKASSQKLFKINGSVSVDKWIELTSHYLFANPLIFEYFEGKLPERLTEIIQLLRKEQAKLL